MFILFKNGSNFGGNKQGGNWGSGNKQSGHFGQGNRSFGQKQGGGGGPGGPGGPMRNQRNNQRGGPPQSGDGQLKPGQREVSLSILTTKYFKSITSTVWKIIF